VATTKKVCASLVLTALDLALAYVEHAQNCGTQAEAERHLRRAASVESAAARWLQTEPFTASERARIREKHNLLRARIDLPETKSTSDAPHTRSSSVIRVKQRLNIKALAG
jgi:hypothetical protein